TRLLQGQHVFHAPELILPEFASILWKKVRRGEVSAAEGERILTAFSAKSLILHSHKRLIRSAYTGAGTTGQTVYDWTYLALAVSLSCELVTADEAFYKALESTPLRANLLWIESVP
ncbi:MAG: type II toxin-antitoxin system VapC family toxin, partial [Blastocatellia bacterium]